MKKSSSGVTLLELLIACMITVIIGASLLAVFYSGRAAQQSGEALVDAFRSGRDAVDVMRREISSMFISAPNAVFDEIGLYYDGTDGGSGEFRFYALLSGHSGEWDLCRVGFRHNEEKREIQRLFNVNLHSAPGESWQPLVSNVNGLEFFLYSKVEGEMVESDYWDTSGGAHHQRGRLPELVKVVIRAQDEKQLFDERIFAVNIAVPAGGRQVYIAYPEEEEEEE